MDVGIVLQSIGSGSSTNTLNGPQFTDAVNRLPHPNGTPYVRSAYVKVYKFMRPNITATFGRQDFALGQGITLSGGDLGLPGGLLEIAGVFRGIKADIFAFRPFKGGRSYKIYGAAAYYPGDADADAPVRRAECGHVTPLLSSSCAPPAPSGGRRCRWA